MYDLLNITEGGAWVCRKASHTIIEKGDGNYHDSILDTGK